MSSAKIVVLSLKEIIRYALIVIVCVSIAVFLLLFFLPNGEKSALEPAGYKDGEYVAKIDIDKGQSFVKVTIEDSSIANIQIVDQDEMAQSFYPLLEPVCSTINNKVITENTIQIDTDYYNQFTTMAVTNAINDALNLAMNF